MFKKKIESRNWKKKKKVNDRHCTRHRGSEREWFEATGIQKVSMQNKTWYGINGWEE